MTGTVLENTQLIELRVQNVKRIELAHFFLEGGVTEITGKNGQGKSTLIDAVIYLLAGNRGVNEKLIRGDADNGVIQGVLMTPDGPVEIRKTIRRGRSVKMSIQGADGRQLENKWLNGLIPAGMMIDVDAFMRMSSRDQVSALAQAAGIADRLSDIQSELEEVMESRKAEKKALVLLEAKNANFIPHRNVPDGEFKVGELVELISAAGKHNQQIATLKAAIAENRQLHEEAKAKIAQIEAWMAKNDEVHVEKVKELDAMGGEEDVTDLQRTLDNAEDLQKKALENQQYFERRKEIAAADLGVPGLSFDENGVTLNGHPFEQASQAEQRVALAALQMDPDAKLKLVLVKDASLWDAETRERFFALCEARGYSALIETVVQSTDNAIEVVDGTVKEEK